MSQVTEDITKRGKLRPSDKEIEFDLRALKEMQEAQTRKLNKLLKLFSKP